jgi:hypothetical protein
MVATRRKPMTILKDADEDTERRRMFLEYREENAKDLQREAGGEW